jgi:hypothetical protein
MTKAIRNRTKNKKKINFATPIEIMAIVGIPSIPAMIPMRRRTKAKYNIFPP